MIDYREATPDDLGFILSSWLKSAGEAWRTLRTADAATFACTEVGWFADVPHRFTRNAVAEILQRSTVRVVVACDSDDATVIYGYAVGEPEQRIMHWCHVKHTMRRNGIAREVVSRVLPDFETAGATCTYLGRGYAAWAARWPLRFNPHAGR